MRSMIRPSTCTADPWVDARPRRGSPQGLLRPTPRVGKWIIFGEAAATDVLWEGIYKAPTDGSLGISAKAATSHPNVVRDYGNKRVICVYTYDGDDEADVFRVRDLLRRLGVTKKLYWNADSETLAGNYGGPGKRVSRYEG